MTAATAMSGRHAHRATLLLGLFNWAVWFLMTALVFSQFLGIVWDTSTKDGRYYYGQDPKLGPAPIGGFNDEPYGDRAIICMARGRSFTSMQLSTALADEKLARVVDTSGASINGFRVVRRSNEMTLEPASADFYTYACDRIDYMLDTIQDSCDAAGYHVTRDALRVVNGVFSNTTLEIPKALPVIILPFWDNGVYMLFIMPGTDGSACVFRLEGQYTNQNAKYAVFRTVPKTLHHAKTVEWLRMPGGEWKNGWYNTRDGQRWFAGMMTNKNGGAYGIEEWRYDTLRHEVVDCTKDRGHPRCTPTTLELKWGQLTTTTTIPREDQVFITNGSRYGLFLFDGAAVDTTKNVYSLETFISNTSVFIILIRWLVSLGAMLYTYVARVGDWQTTGVGAISSSRTFNLLPLVLLPKLKLTLCVFFSVGCFFEGQQTALTNAWYVIYPGIIDFMLFYYSMLNTIAKFSYRRMSDALFGPTLLILCGVHYYRKEIAEWKVLDLNGRIAIRLLSEEVDALRLTDFFTSDVAMRLNGNVKLIFWFKIGLLLVNLVPLLLSEDMAATRGKKFKAFPTCGIERSLALRASNLGGLGRSDVYVRSSGSIALTAAPKATDIAHPSTSMVVPFSVPSTQRKHSNPEAPENQHALCEHFVSNAQLAVDHVLIAYEMSRLGYLVYGGRFLLSFDDWYILTSLAPLRLVEKLWNYRITIYKVARTDSGAYRVVGCPQVCRLDDPRLMAIPFYKVSVGAFH